MRKKRNITHKKQHVAMSVVTALFLFFSSFLYAQSATLSLSSSSGTYTVGDQFDVSVMVSTEGDAINALSGTVSFPGSSLEIVSVSSAGSMIALWMPGAPSYAGNSVVFEGIVPNPGFVGSSGKIVTVRYRALSTGVSTLSFLSPSVLKNDGLATEVLNTAISKTITIVEADVPDVEPPPVDVPDPVEPPPVDVPGTQQPSTQPGGASTTAVLLPAPVISSLSHPDHTLWYAGNEVDITWKTDEEVSVVRLDATRFPDSVPTTVLPREQTSKTLTLDDGVWYVHVQSGNDAGWGDIAHYQVRIDTQQPSDITIRQLASDEVRPGTFSTDFVINVVDVPSGVDSAELRLNDSDDFVRIDTFPYSFRAEGLLSGAHTITVRAVDRAGNSIVKSITFILSPFDALGIGEMIARGVIPEGDNDIGAPMSTRVPPEVISIVSFAGFGVGFGNLAILAGSVVSFADIWLVALRFFSSIAGFFRRRKSEPWGVVYDSVTKQPLDPAYVVIKKDGEQAGMAITDLDGRYGFLVSSGQYTIEANKTHYVFPSEKLRGKKRDQFYDNLYFGETIDVSDVEKDVVRYNIPLDPVGFDWNEFAKKERGLFYIHSKKKMFIRLVSNIVFFAGLSISVYVMWHHPTFFNAGLFSLYAIVLLIQTFWKASHPVTKIMYDLAHQSIPFAVVKAYLTGSDMLIKTVVADERGHFYLLTPPGEYYFTVEVKKPDGSYSRKYKTASIKLKEGVVVSNVYIKKEKQTHHTRIRITSN